MKTIIFNDEIKTESIKRLIDEIEASEESKTFVKRLKKSSKKNRKNEVLETDLLIYFTSSGGICADADILIDYLGRLNQFMRVELVASQEISSSGFDIFFKTDCHKRIMKDTYAVLHLASTYMQTNNILDKNSEDSFRFRRLQKENQRDMKYFEAIGLTPKELKRMREGKDVYLEYERLLKCLENSKQIIKKQQKEQKSEGAEIQYF